MQGPTKIDYSKLFGFDIVTDELIKGVDFNNPTVGAKLGPKVGSPPPSSPPPPPPPPSTKHDRSIGLTPPWNLARQSCGV